MTFRPQDISPLVVSPPFSTLVVSPPIPFPPFLLSIDTGFAHTCITHGLVVPPLNIFNYLFVKELHGAIDPILGNLRTVFGGKVGGWMDGRMYMQSCTLHGP